MSGIDNEKNGGPDSAEKHVEELTMDYVRRYVDQFSDLNELQRSSIMLIFTRNNLIRPGSIKGLYNELVFVGPEMFLANHRTSESASEVEPTAAEHFAKATGKLDIRKTGEISLETRREAVAASAVNDTGAPAKDAKRTTATGLRRPILTPEDSQSAALGPSRRRITSGGFKPPTAEELAAHRRAMEAAKATATDETKPSTKEGGLLASLKEIFGKAAEEAERGDFEK